MGLWLNIKFKCLLPLSTTELIYLKCFKTHSEEEQILYVLVAVVYYSVVLCCCKCILLFIKGVAKTYVDQNQYNNPSVTEVRQCKINQSKSNRNEITETRKQKQNEILLGYPYQQSSIYLRYNEV